MQYEYKSKFINLLFQSSVLNNYTVNNVISIKISS